MVKKSKLLSALDAQQGRDFEAEKRKKQVKAAEKRKRQKAEQLPNGETNNEADEEGLHPRKKKAKLDLKPSVPLPTSQSDSEQESATDGMIETIPQPVENGDASASEVEDESDVPLSELEDEDMEDTVPHQRLTINNGPALKASRKRVTVAKASMPFHYHNSLVSTLPASEISIPDPNDDVTRELEFYRIARDAVTTARSLLKKEKIPFTRPADYFAEMVKSDEHMGKIKKKLHDEASSKKASEEARKLRDAKKFGKAVQIAKEQERAKEKRATLDNIKELKKKRKGQIPGATTEGDDLFQEISVENDSTKSRDGSSRGRGGRPQLDRQNRDSKFGFGGKKRFSKSGDTISSSDMSGFSSRQMKGRNSPGGGRGRGRGSGSGGRGGGGKRPTTKRLGKSKRTASRS